MRTILFVFLLLAAPSAWAQSPDERAYLTERNAAIGTLQKKFDEAQHKRLSDALEARLRRIVVRTAPPKGFAEPGAFSPDTLCCGMMTRRLDGLRFTATDEAGGAVIVTTEGLLRAWLGEQKLPAASESNFRTGDFYTKAIVGEADVTLFAPLPITKPAGATVAVAALALASQMGATSPPRQIAVSVLKGGRAYVALVTATPRPEPIVACEAVLNDLRNKATATQSEAAFVKCWAERMKGEPAFAGLTRQAQALVDAFAAE